jgi:hypothetical protein
MSPKFRRLTSKIEINTLLLAVSVSVSKGFPGRCDWFRSADVRQKGKVSVSSVQILLQRGFQHCRSPQKKKRLFFPSSVCSNLLLLSPSIPPSQAPFYVQEYREIFLPHLVFSELCHAEVCRLHDPGSWGERVGLGVAFLPLLA